MDLADHVAAGHERRHRLEQLAASPQRPRAGGPEHLVAAEDVEVGADLLDVDRHVRDRLRAVDQDQRAGRVGHLGHLADGVDRSEHVRDVGEGDELGPQVQQDLVHLEAQDAVVRDGHELQVAVHLLDHELPGDEIGVVLHLGQDDRVAPADVAATPRIRHQVDGLRGVADEDDLVRIRGVDQAGDLDPRLLVGAGRALRHLVDAAVDVRAVLAVVAVHGLDDGERLEARGGRVEVDERLAEAIGGRQDREVGAEPVGIETGGRSLAGGPGCREFGHSIGPP